MDNRYGNRCKSFQPAELSPTLTNSLFDLVTLHIFLLIVTMAPGSKVCPGTTWIRASYHPSQVWVVITEPSTEASFSTTTEAQAYPPIPRMFVNINITNTATVNFLNSFSNFPPFEIFYRKLLNFRSILIFLNHHFFCFFLLFYFFNIHKYIKNIFKHYLLPI